MWKHELSIGTVAWDLMNSVRLLRPSWQTLFHNCTLGSPESGRTREDLKNRSQATDGTDDGVAADHAMKCLQ